VDSPNWVVPVLKGPSVSFGEDGPTSTVFPGPGVYALVFAGTGERVGTVGAGEAVWQAAIETSPRKNDRYQMGKKQFLTRVVIRQSISLNSIMSSMAELDGNDLA